MLNAAWSAPPVTDHVTVSLAVTSPIVLVPSVTEKLLPLVIVGALGPISSILVIVPDEISVFVVI